MKNIKSNTDIKRKLKKNIVSALVVSMVLGFLGLIGGMMLTPTEYTGASTIIISNEVSNIQVSKDLISTYKFIIKSDKVLNQVISDSRISDDVKSLSRKIKISTFRNTQAMEISYTDNDERKVLQVINNITNIAPETIVNTAGGNYEILSDASVSKNIFSTGAKVISLIFFTTGLIVSGIILSASKGFNGNIKYEEDISEKLGLNVLGVIPELKKGE